MQDAALLQAGGEEVERAGLDDAPLVVAGLGPGIREEDADAIEGLWCEHADHDLDAVAADHADVVDVVAHNGTQ